MREVLDHVKTRFYEIEELTADWNSERRDKVVTIWMSMLEKQIGPMRRQGAAQALKELKEEDRSWPVSHNLEEGEVKDEDFIGDYNSEAEG